MIYVLNKKTEEEKSHGHQTEILIEQPIQIGEQPMNNSENKDKKISVEEKIDILSDKISKLEKNGLSHITEELLNLKTICLKTQNKVENIRLVSDTTEHHILDLINFIKENKFVLTSDLQEDMRFNFLTNGDRKRKFLRYCEDNGEILVKIKIKNKIGSPPSLWFFNEQEDWFILFLLRQKLTIEENKKFKINLEKGNEIIKKIEENKTLNKIFERKDNFFIVKKEGKRRIKYF